MERFLENAMYASRWLLAPVYFGLSLALVALALKFFQEIIHVLPNIFSMAESDLILVLLSLVDMTLVGGLLVGFGAKLGNGCTSGHGICGIGRLSVRSIVATLLFMLAGMVTVFIMRHVLA